MFISLETIDVWEVIGDFDVADFFLALSVITKESDIVAIGSYDPPPDILNKLITLNVPIDRKNHYTPFDDFCFYVNRYEYPRGLALAFNTQKEHLRVLAQCAKEGKDEYRKSFIDHVVAYRPEDPLLPLMDFHDAFQGGRLLFSGHYSDEAMEVFAKRLGTTVSRILNPVLPPLVYDS
jgi:hypothetical protein